MLSSGVEASYGIIRTMVIYFGSAVGGSLFGALLATSKG